MTGLDKRRHAESGETRFAAWNLYSGVPDSWALRGGHTRMTSRAAYRAAAKPESGFQYGEIPPGIAR